jgi:pSer/pThr/pTyr-binding forkhead associated (FHA) protein
MTGILLVAHGADQGQTFWLAEGEALLIGRGLDSGTRLNDPCVARSHCRLACAEGKAILWDCGSKNGTWVNGKRVTQCELHPGDAIRIGETQLWFRWAEDEELKSTDPAQEEP